MPLARAGLRNHVCLVCVVFKLCIMKIYIRKSRMNRIMGMYTMTCITTTQGTLSCLSPGLNYCLHPVVCASSAFYF